MTGFNPITCTFSENSNYWWESLLEVIRQNIAGWCRQTFENKTMFCLTPQANFPAHNLNFHSRWRDRIHISYLLKSFFFFSFFFFNQQYYNAFRFLFLREKRMLLDFFFNRDIVFWKTGKKRLVPFYIPYARHHKQLLIRSRS